MELNYRKCAEEIFATLGGKENIISAAHCATRLRLVIADNSKVDVKTLENVQGVQGYLILVDNYRLLSVPVL